MSDLVYMFETLSIYSDDVASIFSNVFQSWVKNNKAIADEAFANIMKIGNGIMSALGPSLDMLLEKGASLGDVISQAFKDILKQLIKVTIAAAIAVALIAIIFPSKLAAAGGAMKLFGGLFGQGMGLGSSLFGSGAAAGTTAVATGGNSISAIDNAKGIGSNINITGKIAGNDILLVSQKAQRNNTLSF